MELFADILATAFDALKNGHTLLYPTDTIWGIGCDAANWDAVERIYAIKERDHSKAMLLLVTASMLSRNMPVEVRGLLLESERPTTVIVPADMVCRKVAKNLPAGDGTIGVRVPRMDFCQQLLERLDSPIVSTSANFSGHPSPHCYGDIDESLKGRVDCCLPDSPLFWHPSVGSSRILKVEPDGRVTVIRG